ncbi:MAG: hypothetical protein KDA60_00030 [Planctomycetales bacterium]|nr:hypothetical protein [Planctomycetales bacterium]
MAIRSPSPPAELRWLTTSFLCCCLMMCPFGATQADTTGATTNRNARRDAAQSIPLWNMTPDMQQRIRAVLDKSTIYRRLPESQIDCDPDLYLFLMRNPDVVVDIWRIMDATQINLKRVAPFRYEAADGAGTTSTVELVYGTEDIHVFFGEGVYDGPLLRRPVNGRSVVVVRTQYSQDAQGRPQISSVLDMFLQIDHLGVDALAKTFQPFFGKYADYNFTETSRFLSRLSLTAEKNPDGVQRLAHRLSELPEPVRMEFASVASRIDGRTALSNNHAIHRMSHQTSAPSRQPIPVSRYPADFPVYR